MPVSNESSPCLHNRDLRRVAAFRRRLYYERVGRRQMPTILTQVLSYHGPFRAGTRASGSLIKLDILVHCHNHGARRAIPESGHTEILSAGDVENNRASLSPKGLKLSLAAPAVFHCRYLDVSIHHFGLNPSCPLHHGRGTCRAGTSIAAGTKGKRAGHRAFTFLIPSH